MSDPERPAGSAGGRTEPGRAGAPGIMVVAGGVMLAVTAAAVLLGPRGEGLLLVLVLSLGALTIALAIALVTLRPTVWPMAWLAVLCVALALLPEPVDPVAAAVCGLASLGFLLGVRLHRQARVGPVDLAVWLAGHRPMAVGAAITTLSAGAAAAVPVGWSPLAAGLVGLGTAVGCALVFALVFRRAT